MATTGDARLMMATFNNGAWQGVGAIPGVPGGASMPSIAVDDGGNPLVAFIALAEGNHGSTGGTPYAAYLRGGSLSSLNQLSTFPGEAPQVLLTPDGEALIFYRALNGAAVATRSVSSAGDIHTSAASFQRGLGFPDAQHSAASIAATGTMLGAGQLSWGQPRVMAQKQDSNWASFAADLVSPTSLEIVAADAFATRVRDDAIAPDRVDFIQLPYGPSPVATSVSLPNGGAPAGSQATAQATVVNLGLAPLGSNATVTFYLDNPGDPGSKIGTANLSAPAAFTAQQGVSVQFASDGAQHEVYAVSTVAGATPPLGRYDAAAIANALPVPTNLRAAGATDGSGNVLNWNVDPSATTGQYSVWRSGSQSGPWVQVGSSDVPAYLDADAVPGGKYFYRVAMDLPNGQHSGLSNVATASPADGSLGPPPS
jgi:hypothetical protein